MGKFLLKALLNGVIVVPLLLWFGTVTFWEAVAAAVVLSVIAYFLGDRVILPATNNLTATIADFGLTFVYVWAVGSFLFWNVSLGETFWIALGVAAVELLFHTMLPQGDNRRRKASA
ncbi:DUF2512 family protein [Paenibacillus sp.]|uniref:DUF2512 family protein n=1 Tax=Paenibacillus sp. TaxID=58172 RepID=UPI002D2AC387|nr:DUF2512 family protein [Paenibacillus sp.]HZG56613.1 DUF2512 family protein [Paenibacillus sp.]